MVNLAKPIYLSTHGLPIYLLTLSPHYNKLWLFKRFNLIKMFILIERMGHEKHLVLLIDLKN